jgi:6-phosphogluconolactonase
MQLTTVTDPQAAAARCAEAIAALLEDALARRGEAHLALNGGSTPRPVYEQLPALVADWSAVHLWFGDERCVAPDDEDSNFRLASETLIAGAGIDASRVHRMRGELGPEEGGRAYAAELTEHLELDAEGRPVLDVAHLGLGPDGHTASLFPDHPALDADAPAVGVRDAPKPPPERISLSLPTLHAARRCVLHTVGAGKREALAHVLGEPSRHWPASLLRRDRLTVIADHAADPSA